MTWNTVFSRLWFLLHYKLYNTGLTVEKKIRYHERVTKGDTGTGLQPCHPGHSRGRGRRTESPGPATLCNLARSCLRIKFKRCGRGSMVSTSLASERLWALFLAPCKIRPAPPITNRQSPLQVIGLQHYVCWKGNYPKFRGYHMVISVYVTKRPHRMFFWK